MATVVLGARPPELESWLARRRGLGQDRYDEVWEGDYHVAPARSAYTSSARHGCASRALTGGAVADALGLP